MPFYYENHVRRFILYIVYTVLYNVFTQKLRLQLIVAINNFSKEKQIIQQHIVHKIHFRNKKAPKIISKLLIFFYF